jgi:hypothetical protein
MSISGTLTSPITTYLASENVLNKANISQAQTDIEQLQQDTLNNSLSINQANYNILQLEIRTTNTESSISTLTDKTQNISAVANSTSVAGNLSVSRNVISNNISPTTSTAVLNITTTGALNYSGTELRFNAGTSNRIVGGGSTTSIISSGQTGFYHSGLTNRVGLVGITNPAYTCEINGDTNLRNTGSYRINGNQVLTSTGLGAQINSSNLTSVGVLTGLTCGGYAQFNANVLVNGDLLLKGNVYDVDTPVIITDAMSITNIGTGPALVVRQDGIQDIIDIQDDGVSVFKIANGGEIQNNPTVVNLQTRTANLETANTAIHTRVDTLENKTSPITNSGSGDITISRYLFRQLVSFSFWRNNSVAFSNDQFINSYVAGYLQFNNGSGWQGVNGFVAPYDGLYHFDFNCRFNDGTGATGIKPIVASSYYIPNDNTFWWSTDGGNRKSNQYSVNIYLTAGQNFNLKTNGSDTFQFIHFSGYLI